MSAPRAKRQFAGAAADPAQRQITSFFASSSSPAAAAASTATFEAQPSRPVLPAETQSNLLNVGMRVRKSVPEGYKTGAYSAFSLFDETDHLRGNKVPRHTAPTRAPPSQRELLPFCGINKIGGLSFSSPEEQQPQPSFNITAVPSLDDVPSLSSSQDSLASTKSTSDGAATPLSINTASRNRKRLHTGDGYGNDDDDSDTPSLSDCLQVPSGEWMDGQVSPRSLVPSGSGWENTRVMAVPRKIRRSSGLSAALPTVVVAGAAALDGVKRDLALGQENMAVDGDFPEADFLDYRMMEGDEMEI